MERKVWNLIAEPKDKLYDELLAHAVESCNIALLVVRKQGWLEPSGQRILDQLSSFLHSKEESTEWPGTRLLGHTAWVYRYHFGQGCANILKQAVDGLYDWVQPERPEDLCLFRDDGSQWLVSIAHERDGFLYLSRRERDSLLEAVPGLKHVLSGEGS